jgi:hypothetical protein
VPRLDAQFHIDYPSHNMQRYRRFAGSTGNRPPARADASFMTGREKKTLKPLRAALTV